MLVEREIIDGKAGKYVWLTYKEVYNTVLNVGESICSRGIEKACNAHGLHCVPLYDTLGAGAVKYIICHVEISIIFAEKTKISEVLKTFPDTGKYLKTLVSFSTVTNEQKLQAEKCGLEIYSWEEFLQLSKQIKDRVELPLRLRSDICVAVSVQQADVIALTKLTCLVLPQEHCGLLQSKLIWSADKAIESCSLVESILHLEPIEVNIFKGITLPDAPRFGKVFGGQFIGQA
ncbi:hypothetical protein L1887_08830 [Cichorium endivia]|nr:hypothetical protein L1887_08830 [Cichorium endivia]